MIVENIEKSWKITSKFHIFEKGSCCIHQIHRFSWFRNYFWEPVKNLFYITAIFAKFWTFKNHQYFLIFWWKSQNSELNGVLKLDILIFGGWSKKVFCSFTQTLQLLFLKFPRKLILKFSKFWLFFKISHIFLKSI